MKKAVLAALLLLGVTAEANYTPPAALYDGYWAMTEPVFGEYVVVSFRRSGTDVVSVQYRFSCADDGSYRQLGAVPYRLSPSRNGLFMYELDGTSPASELLVQRLLPSEGLILEQRFTEKLGALRSVFPEGMVFAYAYTPILRPLCDLEE